MTKGPKVLLVDDEDRFRLTLGRMLKAKGFEVGEAASGPQALEELARQAYDVILLDVRMPGMSGVETLAAIKAAHPDAEVIILSGQASVDTARAISHLDAFDYLFKPAPLEEVIAKIELAYERKLARQERPPASSQD